MPETVSLMARLSRGRAKGTSPRMTSVSTGNSVREVLRQGIARLRQADIPSFTLAAELLLLHVTGRNRTWIYSHPEEILPSAEIAAFFALVDRRSEGEPTQHLTGKQEFWGLEFQVTPDVLILVRKPSMSSRLP
jgi:hypothetical protein